MTIIEAQYNERISSFKFNEIDKNNDRKGRFYDKQTACQTCVPEVVIIKDVHSKLIPQLTEAPNW